MARNTTTTPTTKTPTSTQRRPESTHAIQHLEITSTEPVKLRKFLEKQFGWKFEVHKMDAGEYHAFRTADGNGGGIMAPQGGQPVAVTPYINVEDIDETLKSCKKNGANILMPVTEVPGMGRFFWFQYPGSPPLACWQQTGSP
jgi:uncharacterized protein